MTHTSAIDHREEMIDAHCHLAESGHVAPRVNAGYFWGGYGPEDWQRQKLAVLANRSSAKLWTSFGLHPWYVHKQTDIACEAALAQLRALVEEFRPSAVGELGLDHAAASSRADKNRQLQWLEKQAAFAAALKLPLVMHVVRAHGSMASFLKTQTLQPRAGLIHAFAAEKNVAKDYLDLGFLLSIGPNALVRCPAEVLRYVPAEALVVESDAPDDQSREILIDVAIKLAAIRGIDVGKLFAQSSENIHRVFGQPHAMRHAIRNELSP